MTASRTLSIRLTTSEADQFKQAFQQAGAAGQAAMQSLTSAVAASSTALRTHTQAGQLANYQIIEMTESAHKFADIILSGGSALRGFAFEAPNFIAIAGGMANAMKAVGSALPLLGLGAAAVGIYELGKAADEQESRMRLLGQQVRATRDDYSSYAEALDRTARQLAITTTLSTKDARSTVNAIGLDANFSGNGEDLKRLAIDAQNLSVVLKTDLAGGAKVITDGLDNAAKAAKELGDKGFAGFTPQLVRTIELMQQGGRPADAFGVYLKTVEDRSRGAAVAGLTPLGDAMRQLDQVLHEARDGGKSFVDTVGGGIDRMAANGILNLGRFIDKIYDVGKALNETSRNAQEHNTLMIAPDGAFIAADSAPSLPAPPVAKPGNTSSDPSSYAAMRDRLAREYGVDPDLIARLNRTEGHRGPDGNWQVSTSGAIGGFQLLPGTFADQKGKYGFAGSINDDEANARAGITYYKEALERRGGDPTRAYYDYHDGPAAARTSAAAREAGANFSGYTGPGLTGYAGGDGMVNESRKSAEELEKAIAGTRALTSQQLAAKLEEVERQLQQFELSGRQDTPEYRGLLQREQETKAAQYNMVDPQTAATRDTQRQLDTARLARRYGFTPADDQLAADMSKREDIARTTGSPVTDEVRGQVTSQFYAKANMELDRLEKAQQEASRGQETLAAAYAKGSAAVADATAKNEALHTIGMLLPKDATNYADALQKLTVGYRQAITDAANIKVGQQLGSDQKDMATTAEEMRLVKSGAGPDQTAIDLAGFKARQANDTASPMQQAAIEQSARDKARQQLDLQSTKANYGELSNFADSAFEKIGGSITSAFASGKSAALSFGSIGKSVISELEQEFIKLALINPLKNLISGPNSSLPTLGGVFSSLLGSGSSAAVASAAATTAQSGTTGIGVALGALYHAGGIVGSEPTALRSYHPSAWIGAPRYHVGGIAGDEQPAVLKVGEGVFTPGQMAALAPAGQGGDGDTHVHFHINAQGAGPREIDMLKTQIPMIALQSVQSAMSRGGQFSKIVRGT